MKKINYRYVIEHFHLKGFSLMNIKGQPKYTLRFRLGQCIGLQKPTYIRLSELYWMNANCREPETVKFLGILKCVERRSIKKLYRYL